MSDFEGIDFENLGEELEKIANEFVPAEGPEPGSGSGLPVWLVEALEAEGDIPLEQIVGREIMPRIMETMERVYSVLHDAELQIWREDPDAANGPEQMILLRAPNVFFLHITSILTAMAGVIARYGYEAWEKTNPINSGAEEAEMYRTMGLYVSQAIAFVGAGLSLHWDAEERVK